MRALIIGMGSFKGVLDGLRKRALIFGTRLRAMKV